MSTSAQVRGHRMRLYQPGFHVGLRIAHGFIAALVVAGLVGALFDLRHTADWRSMGVLLLFPILLWALTTVFRTRAVYGSEHGLEFCRRGVWRTVPWSHVQTVEYTWWSFNRVGRIASVVVPGERAPVLFFANDHLLGALRRLRNAAIASASAQEP